MLRYFLPLLFLATDAGISAAQMPPLTVPKGHWRTDITGSFFTARERYRSGTKEDLAFDFARDRLGSNFFPALIPADSLLQKIAGFNDATINRNLFTRSHTEAVADLHSFKRNLLIPTVAHQPGGWWRQVE